MKTFSVMGVELVKGCNYQIEYSRVLKSEIIKPKTVNADKVVVKHTNTIGRFGINYENQNGVENVGVRMNGGEWVDGFENCIIKYSNGNVALKVTPTSLKNFKPSVTYTLNGVDISKQELIDMGILRQPKEDSKPNLYGYEISLKNIISINKVVVE